MYGECIGVVDEPDQVAPSLGSLTYGQVADRSRALAAGLEALGVPVGGRVAIVSKNAARLLDVLFGAPTHGRVAVPVNFRLHPDEVSYIVGPSGAEMLLVDPELAEQMDGVVAPQKFVIGAETGLRFGELEALTNADWDSAGREQMTRCSRGSRWRQPRDPLDPSAS